MPMPGLVTEHEASVILGLSVRTLQKWRLQGNGPRFVKLGHAVRYDPAELEHYIDSARRRSTSDAGSGQGDGQTLHQRA
ncbi:MAG: helix-turn-helix domain-containing protein [Deltaproteobacteria bacterium]|nr:helix-turn-helix domain-containing protein [Deltaproteobacteria bacterium]